MSKKRNNKKIYGLLNAETKPKFFFVYLFFFIFFFTEIELFKKRGSSGLNQKRKVFLTVLTTVIKKDLQCQ